MTDVENMLNDDEFFGNIVDTSKKGIEQHRKQEFLKIVIGSGKAYLSIKAMMHTSSVN